MEEPKGTPVPALDPGRIVLVGTLVDASYKGTERGSEEGMSQRERERWLLHVYVVYKH